MCVTGSNENGYLVTLARVSWVGFLVSASCNRSLQACSYRKLSQSSISILRERISNWIDYWCNNSILWRGNVATSGQLTKNIYQTNIFIDCLIAVSAAYVDATPTNDSKLIIWRTLCSFFLEHPVHLISYIQCGNGTDTTILLCFLIYAYKMLTLSHCTVHLTISPTLLWTPMEKQPKFAHHNILSATFPFNKTYDPDRHQNWTHWSLGHALRLQEISSKSVHNFFSYPTDRQTENRQTSR